jgi:hypothetical protein
MEVLDREAAVEVAVQAQHPLDLGHRGAERVNDFDTPGFGI